MQLSRRIMQTNKTTSNLKFIYWFAYYNLNSPSVRYRGKYPVDFLKKNYGILSSFVIPSYRPNKIIYFIVTYLSALLFRKKGSLIVIQRVHSNFIYSNLLKLLVKVRKTNIVYDLDDADYLEHPPKTINYFIKNCSVVIVGSNELFRNISENGKSIVLNTSPTPDLNITKSNKNPVLTIGWIGSFGGGHKESLINCFFPSIKGLHFKINLILLGVTKKREYDFLANYFKDFDNVILEMPQSIDWRNEENIQQRISEFDIGIATLIDSELHRSKSAFKLKQYLNNGVPVLSSDIQENKLFVKDGQNGFLCTSPADFNQRIVEINEMTQNSYKQLSIEAKNSNVDFDLIHYCDILISTYK